SGLANSSGALGHYLMDHIWVGRGATGEFPDLPAEPRVNGPNRPNGIYIIRFRNPASGQRSKNFLRGYGFQGGGSSDFNFKALGYGPAFKQALRQPIRSEERRVGKECRTRWAA